MAAAQEHFSCPCVIFPLQVIITDPHLEDAPVQLADCPFFTPPGSFQFFVRFKVFPLVEQLQAGYNFMRQGLAAVKGLRLGFRKPGHFAVYHASHYIGKMVDVQCEIEGFVWEGM